MDQPEAEDGRELQPSWTVMVDVESDSLPSRFVEVHVTHRLEVEDVEALRRAVEAADGPPRDDLDRRLREVPANLVGRLLSWPLRLPDLPGVARWGSGLSVGEYELGR